MSERISDIFKGMGLLTLSQIIILFVYGEEAWVEIFKLQLGFLSILLMLAGTVFIIGVKQ